MRSNFALTVLSIAHFFRAIDALLPQRPELQRAPSRTLPDAMSMITPAPILKQNLLGRAAPETCGYVSGNPGRILYQSLPLGAKNGRSFTIDLSARLFLLLDHALRRCMGMLQSDPMSGGI